MARYPGSTYDYRGKIVKDPKGLYVRQSAFGQTEYYVQFHYFRVRNNSAWVNEIKPDDIGDPIKSSRNRRIVYTTPEEYDDLPNNPESEYIVAGPCPFCDMYFANFDAHQAQEAADADI